MVLATQIGRIFAIADRNRENNETWTMGRKLRDTQFVILPNSFIEHDIKITILYIVVVRTELYRGETGNAGQSERTEHSSPPRSQKSGIF